MRCNARSIARHARLFSVSTDTAELPAIDARTTGWRILWAGEEIRADGETSDMPLWERRGRTSVSDHFTA